jgi:hypothetical protein
MVDWFDDTTEAEAGAELVCAAAIVAGIPLNAAATTKAAPAANPSRARLMRFIYLPLWLRDKGFSFTTKQATARRARAVGLDLVGNAGQPERGSGGHVLRIRMRAPQIRNRLLRRDGHPLLGH